MSEFLFSFQHSRMLAEAKEKEPDVVFIGDTIIQDLQQRPIWNDLFEPLHSLNFGMFNDCTEHVLYRIQDGILNNIKPKVSRVVSCFLISIMIQNFIYNVIRLWCFMWVRSISMINQYTLRKRSLRLSKKYKINFPMLS